MVAYSNIESRNNIVSPTMHDIEEIKAAPRTFNESAKNSLCYPKVLYPLIPAESKEELTNPDVIHLDRQNIPKSAEECKILEDVPKEKIILRLPRTSIVLKNKDGDRKSKTQLGKKDIKKHRHKPKTPDQTGTHRRHSSLTARSKSHYDSSDTLRSRDFCKYLMEMPTEGKLIISITDTGCGMSSEDLKNLCKPFSQGNFKIHSKYGGCGIGLWLSNKLLLAMKGHLECESKLGQGTTFRISVPARCRNFGDQKEFVNTNSMFSKLECICLEKNKEILSHNLVNLGCKLTVCNNFDNLVHLLQVF